MSDRIVQDVPADVAVCEFECRKAQCSHTAWTPCPVRAGGEVAPVHYAHRVIPFRLVTKAG